VNTPFLSTAELTKLGWSVGPQVRAAYRKAGVAGRRALLRDVVGPARSPSAESQAGLPVPPAPVWSASLLEVCRLVGGLLARAGHDPSGVAAGLLGVSDGGVPVPPGAAAGFKGGTGPGSTTAVWWVRPPAARGYTVVAVASGCFQDMGACERVRQYGASLVKGIVR
jgi:hypothetical protein